MFANGRVKAECEMRRILRLGGIVPVDLDVVGRCILSLRSVVLVGTLERVCVIGRVQETSLSFGLGRGCTGTDDGVAGALDGSMD